MIAKCFQLFIIEIKLYINILFLFTFQMIKKFWFWLNRYFIEFRCFGRNDKMQLSVRFGSSAEPLVRLGSVVRQNHWFGEPNRIPNLKGEIEEKIA